MLEGSSAAEAWCKPWEWVGSSWRSSTFAVKYLSLGITPPRVPAALKAAEDLLKFFAALFQAIDGLWFVTLEDEYGADNALKLDIKVWERYGRLEAKRIASFIGVRLGAAGLNELIEAFRVSPVATLFEPVFEVGDEALVKITKCPPQEARIRRGRGILPCKPVGLAYFKSFAGELNPSFKVECLWCPPDPRNPEAWCAWRFRL